MELSGRTARRVRDGAGWRVEARAGAAATRAALAAFQAGEARVAVVTEAASAGISLHADRRVRNQQQRVLVENLFWVRKLGFASALTKCLWGSAAQARFEL